MGILRTALFTGVLLAAGLPRATAQAGTTDSDPGRLALPLDLASGTRVRLTAPGSGHQPLIGSILAVDETTLTVADQDGTAVKVPRRLVTRLDVSRGRKSQALPGLLAGAIAGAFIPAALPYFPSKGGDLLAGSMAGFAVIGALVGAHQKTDIWEKVPSERVRVVIQPGLSRRGAGLAVTLAF